MTSSPTATATTPTTTPTATAVTAGQNILTYKGHPSPVLAAAWYRDGKRVVSGDGTGGVHIWDATTGTVLLKYQGHSGESITSLAWSPNGQYIVSGGGPVMAPTGGSVQVWDPTTGKLLVKY